MKPESYRKRLNRKIEQMRIARIVTGSSPVFGILDSLVAVAERHRVKPVLMSSPWREDLIEAVAPEKIRGFAESVRAYAANRDLQYIDLFQEHFDAGQWHDGNHLASEGARELTAMVRKRIFGWKGMGE